MNKATLNEGAITLDKPVAGISLTAARLSWAAVAMSLVLLAALHAVSLGFDPSWRMVSEYGLGDYG
jgi:hypothetical protein